MASEIDPEGGRTLRILTKPYLVDIEAEHNVIRLVHDGKIEWITGLDPRSKSRSKITSSW